MSVYKDSRTGSFIVDVGFTDLAGRKRRIRKQAPQSRGEAERMERALKKAVRVGKIEAAEAIVAPPPPPPVAAFSGFANKWFEEFVCIRHRHSVQRVTEQILRIHLVPFFGDRDLRTITARDVEEYVVRKSRERLKPKTINNHLGHLGVLMKAAIREGYADRNPVPEVSKLKVGEQEFDWLRQEEADQFLAASAVQDPAYFPLFLVAVRTGLRLSELLGLRWRDVDLGRKEVRVSHARVRGHDGHTKSGKNRQVPLPAQAVEALRRLDPRTARVFLAPDGSELTLDKIKRPFWRALKHAGLRHIRFHDLRHTYASHLVSGGAPIQVVKELLGHADIKMTLRYAHLAPDTKRGFVEALDRPLPVPDRGSDDR